MQVDCGWLHSFVLDVEGSVWLVALGPLLVPLGPLFAHTFQRVPELSHIALEAPTSIDMGSGLWASLTYLSCKLFLK